MNQSELEEILKLSQEEAMLHPDLIRVIRTVKVIFFKHVKKEYGQKISEGDLKDIFHEAILTLLKKIKKEGAQAIKSTVEAFIMQACKYKLSEYLKRQKQHNKNLEKLLDKTNYLPKIEDVAVNIDNRLEQEIWTKLIHKHLPELGEICVIILILRFWEDKTFAEIVEEMPILLNENNAKQRFRSCIQKLRILLKV